MYEWNYAVQRMLDWVEENVGSGATLEELARYIGYSKSYCSSLFHHVTGVTLKQYMAGRRLCKATLQVRDTGERILEIALACGYSSQSALTRAFLHAYGCTPAAYRRRPAPIPLSVRKVALHPSQYCIERGVLKMSNSNLVDAQTWMEHIPAHKFVGLYDLNAKGYWNFENRPDFEEIVGYLNSMIPVQDPVVGAHHAGWFYKDGKKGYFYGCGVPVNYIGPIPKGFIVRDIPASYYLVFGHPNFSYPKDNVEVMRRVESLAWSFDPASMGYAWNEDDCQDYQRHMPESRGYQVLRPVKKL